MKIVGLSGISGSGKTQLLTKLKSTLGDQVSVISSDNYYRPIEFQKKDENGEANFDLPEGINDLDFYNDILKLKEGHTLVKQVYNFNNPKAKEAYIEIKPSSLLIVEGLFIYHFPHIVSQLNYKVFLNLHPEIALNRRLLRDEKERGIPQSTTQYQWYNHTLPGFENFVKPYQPYADLVIDNHNPLSEAYDTLLKAIQQILKTN